MKVQVFYDADASLILYVSWEFAFKMDTKIIISQLEKHIFSYWEYESASDILWLYFDLFVFAIFTIFVSGLVLDQVKKKTM